jgi:hypothetical protein
VLLSAADRRAIVLRNGIEIGRARVEFSDAQPLGTHLFVIAQPTAAESPQWIAVGAPGAQDAEGTPLDPRRADRVRLSPEFLAVTRPLLVPGTTLYVTDAPILPQHSGTELTIVSNQPPEA